MSQMVDFTTLTGEQWLDMLLAQSRDGRIQMATRAVMVNENHQRGSDCFMGDHVERIEAASKALRTVRESIVDLRASVGEMSEAAQPGVHAVLDRLDYELRRVAL